MLTMGFFWWVHSIDLENIWIAAMGAAGFMLLYFVLLFLFRKTKVKEIVKVMQKVHPMFNRLETLLFGRK